MISLGTIVDKKTVIPTSWLQSVNDILSVQDQPQGGNGVGYSPTFNYVAQTIGAGLRDTYSSLLSFITDPAERLAIMAYTSTTDHTAVISAAFAYNKKIYAPAGLWNISAATGVVMPTGASLVGDGLMKTVFKAAANGGTLVELQTYVKGSLFKRAFFPGVANDYVFSWYVADIALILNHPAYNAGNYKQIGFDARNVTRSVFERVYVGNEAPTTTGFPIVVAPSATDRCQGYGFVLGTKSSASPDYCGGEGNTLRNCMAWGVYKNITVDDSSLSVGSSAHATVIDTCDVQHGHELLTQSSATTHGFVINRATIQGNDRQSGNVNPTVGIASTGQGASISVKYAEMSVNCDQLFQFASASGTSSCVIQDYSYVAPSTGLITDSAPGNGNALLYRAAVAGIGSGPVVDLYNGARRLSSYIGNFVGAAQTVTAASGITLSRVSGGLYMITLDFAQPNSHWVPQIILDTDGSSHGGMVALQFGTQSASQINFVTYSQNGGTTTQIDPVKMWITVQQSV